MRADSSLDIGAGHVMRCLALAQAFRDAGSEAAPVHFAVASLPPRVRARLTEEGFLVHDIGVARGHAGDAAATAALAREVGARWVVLDGYAFDRMYEQAMLKAGLQVLAYDDYVHTDHVAHVVLNQNLHARESLYRRAPGVRLLLGTRYTALRREFALWRSWRREVASQARTVLVTLGGSDPHGVTLRAVEALAGFPGIEAKILVGGATTDLDGFRREIETRAAVRVLVDAPNMAELMAQADVAIAAAGSTSWELSFMGLPSLLIPVADNQREIAAGLDATGVAESLGWHADVTAARIAEGLARLLGDRRRRARMSALGRELVDGQGGLRVARVLKELTPATESSPGAGPVPDRSPQDVGLRPLLEADLALVLRWRNSERVRLGMYTDHHITMDEHQAWFRSWRERRNDEYMIFERQQKPAGVVYFTQIDRATGRAFFGFYLGEEHLPRGTGTTMGLLAMRYAFETLHLRKVCGEVFHFNEASLRLFRRLGFAEEGRLRKHACKNGGYEDVVIFGLLADDWRDQALPPTSDLRPQA